MAQIRDKLFAAKCLAPREYSDMKRGEEIKPKYSWTTRQIHRILINEQYAGSYVSGKFESTRIGVKSLIVHDRADWIIRPDSHPPIVGKEDFTRVQEMLRNPKAFITERPKPSNQADKVRERIVNGERRSNAVPYGYNVKNGVWEINTETADVVRMIFNMTLNGLSTNDIAVKLRELGIPTLKEYRRISKGEVITPTNYWKQQAVKDILQDKQYIGFYVAGKTYGDTDSRKFHRPKSEWIIIPDKHPAIISKDIFTEVQKIRSQSRKNMKRRDYLLSGKVVCGCCGYAMTYGESTNPPAYRCGNTHADPAAECHKMKVCAPELDEAVMAIIKKQAEVVLESGDISKLRKKNEVERRTSECEKQIRLCIEQRQNHYEQFIHGEIDRDTHLKLKVECTAQFDRLNNQLAIL